MCSYCLDVAVVQRLKKAQKSALILHKKWLCEEIYFWNVTLKYFSRVLNTYKQLKDLKEILSRKVEMLKVLYCQTNEKTPHSNGFRHKAINHWLWTLGELLYFTVLLVLFYKITNTEKIAHIYLPQQKRFLTEWA